ncbi:hypothetical protein [Amycolatopsis balhimycina]|uniref:hypothetical protein n=1 Tax=Amycolatopsis balhimycina TaxID=208443 RepID=UPI0012FA62E3|nr:hypothetical protein [Amycolatopsis balhimycina]
MKARGWTSHTQHGHGEEVTDMQRTAYSARCATELPSGASSRGAENPERAGDYQV